MSLNTAYQIQAKLCYAEFSTITTFNEKSQC